MHHIRFVGRINAKFRPSTIQRYIRSFQTKKHECPPCCSDLKDEIIKCPDASYCGKPIKPKGRKKMQTPKLDAKEELDNPDCPWCRKK